ncbi:PilZ domain-containing protein [Thiohalorhabdus sp. Cl-TMA]|uniref:PilZ domain-containing protein n=1 Tax=Thiohalorhabdus methylotrophus TaxID=3242694 RepID=A0ABV4TTH5_9GAMM
MSEDQQSQSGKDRRNFYRVTTRLRFRFLPASLSDRPWLHLEPGPAPFLHRPDDKTLHQARSLLEEVPRRTINLSEGGMRVRLPGQVTDRTALGDGKAVRPRELLVLLEFPEDKGRAVFGLPARLVRVDSLPWAIFPALTFKDLPEPMRRRLAGFVVTVGRQRRRSKLHGAGAEEGGDMARRLARLESAETSARHARLQARPRRRNRFFP